MTERAIFVFEVRAARRRAMNVAIMEACMLFEDLGAQHLVNGLMSDQSGLFSLAVSEENADEIINRFERLGYTKSVSQVDFDVQKKGRRSKKTPTWKGQPYELKEVYHENPRVMREKAPDRRSFLLPDAEGNIREVVGYRGSGGETTKRGLPVADCRALVNLIHPVKNNSFLDPFAGAGGIVIEAIESGLKTFSLDVDPILRYGLKSLGADHTIGDVREIPFERGSFDAIATEVPFERNVTDMILEGLEEMYRVLKEDGNLALMAADHQATVIQNKAEQLGLQCYLEERVDRKGFPVSVYAWSKSEPILEKRKFELRL